MQYHYYIYSADNWHLIKTYKTRGGARKAAKRDMEVSYSSAIVPSYSLAGDAPSMISGPRMKRMVDTVPREVRIYAAHM